MKKGDIIATLYKDRGHKEGRLVHLHFELGDGRDVEHRIIDPIGVFPELSKFICRPQKHTQFKVIDFKNLHGIEIANFQRLNFD